MIRRINKYCGDRRGQTAVEYLMLTALAFMVAYMLAIRPFAKFSADMMFTIHNNLHNAVSAAEMSQGPRITPQDDLHPSNPARFKALHLK